jgi:predicted transcriptional regulator of viral defense system
MLTNNIIIYNKLKDRLTFSFEDISIALGITKESSKVLCSRYTAKGILIRLKKNLYTFPQKWDTYTQEYFLKISNLLQVPSYISLITALSYYEITTQVQQNYFENISLKRTKRYDIKGSLFNYYKIQKKYYSDFIKTNGIFIATKEKAFTDAVYLYSFGKYKIDLSSIDLNKLDKNKINKLMKIYPLKTKLIMEKLCKI